MEITNERRITAGSDVIFDVSAARDRTAWAAGRTWSSSLAVKTVAWLERVQRYADACNLEASNIFGMVLFPW